METYDNNGICQYLNAKAKNIFLTDLTKSMLIIADKKTQEPLVVVLDDRVDSISDQVTSEEKETIEIGKVISDKTKLPFFIIRYCDGLDNSFSEREINIGEYHPNANDLTFMVSTIDYFVKRLNDNGIIASYERRSPQKQTNDKLSSDFHYWQRECLRVGIFTDIDMIRYDARNGVIERVYELKRSKEFFEDWKPYYKEIYNYRILARVCEMMGVQFYIVFNGQKRIDQMTRRLINYYYLVTKRNGEKYYDDVMELRIFLMCKPIGGSIEEIVPVEAEHITIDHFIQSDQVSILKEKYWNMRGQESDSYGIKNRQLCYCDPLKQYDEKYHGKKFFHAYEDCEWLDHNDYVKTLYRYEAYAEGYELMCKKCREKENKD